MRRDAFRKIPGILARYRRHSAWRKVVQVMACVVVFCTTYALILPAITLEKKPVCGLDEHTHTEGCYTQITDVEKREPACTLESDGCLVVHRHDEYCYDENGQMWCTLPELAAHTHTDSCYAPSEPHTHGEGCYQKEQGELVCALTEGEAAHTHTKEAGCYKETRTLTCGLEESDGHTHGDSCKDEAGAFVCGLEESEGHYHGEACYTTVEELTCTLSDQPHQHTDACYAWEDVLTCTRSTEPGEPTLICGKEELELHEHTDSCYEAGGTDPICGKPRVIEHAHTDACFKTQGEKVDTETRTCGIEAGAGAHAHTEKCYDAEKNLICGSGHKHTKLCYGVWDLTCGKEEHTHTEACMVDVENEEDWKKTLPETLKNEWREDLLAVAESQLDYAEARPDFQLGEEPHRWSRYGEWYGQPEEDWNSLFVLFCLHYAEIPEDDLPQDSDTAAWVEKLAGRTEDFEEYQLYYSAEDYTPQPGDLVFFGLDEDEAADRVGIVTKYDPEAAKALAVSENEKAEDVVIAGKIPVVLETIEGDVSGQVAKQRYPMEGVRILGYAQLPEQPVEVVVEPVLICTKEEHTHTELCASLSPDGKSLTVTCGKEEHTHTEECWSDQPVAYTWSQDGLEITAAFAPGTVLPENATLTVDRQTPDTPTPLTQLFNVGNGLARSSEEDTTPVGSGLARSSEPDGTGTVPSEPHGTAAVSPEPDAPAVGSGLARSSEEDGTGTSNDTTPDPAESQQACLLTAEEDPPQQTMNTCIDYFRVCLTVDGAEVDTQAPAEVTIRLQGEQYPDDAGIQLIQLTGDSEQTVLAQPDAAGNLTANFTGTLAGEYAVMALADAQPAPMAAGTNVAASITNSKTIEALAEANTYRLHLDAVVGASMMDSPMNMLLVLDRSGSMRDQMDPSSSSRKSRDEVLNEVVNDTKDDYGRTTKGLIHNFLDKNQQNRVAVIGFAGADNYTDGSHDVSELRKWTSTTTSVTLEGGSGATNYCAAFMKADEWLTEIENRNSNPTIMVFLSDGQPTYYFTESGKREGRGDEEDPVKVSECIEGSKPYFDKYIQNRHPNVTVYTVGMSTDIVGGGKDAILQEMAQKGGGEYFPVTTANQLKTAINSISSGKTYTDLKIEDKLSAYVDLSDEPQYKVTKKSADGTEVPLWEGTSATADGTNIIQSVGYDTGTKTVTATFVPTYELEPGATYSLSYNVKVSQTAKDEYGASNTYPNTGDPNTDFGSNTTSSGQPGFHSNEVATMSYKADGTDGHKTYPHPVVQVTGPMAQPELEFTPHKTIDALREGADNPDTTLDDGLTEEEKIDLYRLYLDAEISPQTKPIDLLLVVDQSGSMHDDYSANRGPDMTDYDGNPKYRNEALNLVLNGANNNDGLIAKFLNANKDNWLAIASFQAGTTDASHDYGQSKAPFGIDANGDPNIDYEGGDASTLLDWTQTPGQVTIEGKYANATNYMAGFQQADKLLNSGTIKNNGHNKVMIFLSDGLPTCYIATDGKGNYWRDGDGTTDGSGTGSATDTAFEEFVGQHPDLLIHTISLKAGAAETRLDGMKSPDVGHCYSVHDTNELRKALSKLMYGTAYTELKIEDALSADVELCEQPDYKVTLTTPEGTVTTLYAGGKVTDQGKGILESVAYDSASRKVTATFNPSYTPAPGNKVTLSFNVITTQNAYDKFKASGYGDVKGDNSTDYTGNTTSSGQPGFYSNDNDKTQVSYKKYNETTTTTQNYPRPVIQVDPNKDQPTVPDTSNLKLTPHKTIDAFGDNTDNPDTTLDNTATDKTELYRLYLDAQVGPPVGMPMDLLLVVDESRSMRDYSIGNSDSTRRETALLNVLNGEGTEEGLISKFINMDAGNYIAVVGFNSTGGVRRGWGRNASDFVPDSGTYTNYCDAFTEAKQLLAEAKRDRPNNPKVMVFLSDGAPTAWYDEGGRYRTTGLSYNPNDQSIQRSKDYFDDLWAGNSDVKLITVNISSFESKVLPYMVEQSKGQYLTANSVDQLGQALESAAWGNAYNNVRIQDKLSAYVDVHPTQPDYKVTMKDAAGVETVLWQGNAPTTAGNGIIQSVAYDAVTKTVTATFKPSYVLEPDHTYTLSYNVKVTDKAYEVFGTDGYKDIIGDSGTDYTGNATSSNQPGFRSNDTATLSYRKDGVDDSKTYSHPVVQVVPSALTVQKKWFSKEGVDITDTQGKVSEVQFQLIKIATPLEGPEPEKATINVTSRWRQGYYGWSTGIGGTFSAPIGSTATLTIQMRNSRYLQVDSVKANGTTLSGQDSYTYTFKVEGTMDINLDCQCSLATAGPISTLALTYDPSTVPTVDTTPFEVSRKTYTLSRPNWQMSFTDLPKTGMETIGGKDVSVTYEYDVKELPVAGYTSKTTKETSGSRGTVFTIKNTSDTPSRRIIIRKTDGEDATKVLPGAQFELYRKALDGETGVKLGKLDGTYILLNQPDNPDGSRPATDANGLLSFTGLEDGSYWLVETKAPSGYHKNAEPIPFTINPDGSVTCSVDGVIVGVAAGEEPVPMLTVPNKPWGHKLPNTGGAGTQPYTIGGMLILSLAFFLLYEQKKRGKGDVISS